MLKRVRWYLWVLIGILIIYTGISVYFMDHFFLGTTINGENAEFLTTRQANTLVIRQAESYELVLQERDGTTTALKPEEFGVTFYETDAVQHVKRMQNGFLWPRMFWQVDSYQIVPGTRIDEESLASMVHKLDCVRSGKKPENAWIELKEDTYEVHKEDPGDKIEPEMLAE